jgi:hypothetical protein
MRGNCNRPKHLKERRPGIPPGLIRNSKSSFYFTIKEKLRIDVGNHEHGATLRDENGRDVFVYYKFKDNDPRYFYEAVANRLSSAESEIAQH